MKPSFDFAGRTVLVTGGARGIGAELSHRLVARGARVLAVGRDGERLAGLANIHRGAVATFQADLGADGAVAEVAAWVRNHHPECSALINNAAVMNHVDLTDDRPAHLGAIASEIAINLVAPLQLAVSLLPILRVHERSAIVNVTSGLAIAPKRDAAVYCATKAAVRSFTRSLRDQCRKSELPIQVTEVVMTLVDTTLSQPAARKYAPTLAADDLIVGVEKGQDEVWIEKAKLLRLVHRLSPALAYRIMRGR